VKKAVLATHHEDFYGNGYPLGLEGRSISVLARVLRIVDTFDAMTSHVDPIKRPFRPVRLIQLMIAAPEDDRPYTAALGYGLAAVF
jgi:HD-GYP domain-containing protein (c-di-GMP phosphodiesterase class II)